ncbi:MAG: hypothetical protein LBK82_11660 [Planctomycetaceae bacterium]|nr:hypothetical protein [Planctomycetaceae bacterium]
MNAQIRIPKKANQSGKKTIKRIGNMAQTGRNPAVLILNGNTLTNIPTEEPTPRRNKNFD